MHQRLAAEGKPGATMASGGAYDGWWNGGIRNTGNFHNIIAILTETIGSPTPMRIPLVLAAPDPEPRPALSDRAAGVALQAVGRLFDLVQPRRDRLRVAQPRAPALQHLQDGPARDRSRQRGLRGRRRRRGSRRCRREVGRWRSRRRYAGARRELWAELRKPELRDPRGYIIPSDQPDFPTAIKFVNALREVNVAVQRATTRVRRRRQDAIPPGSFVVIDGAGVPPARARHVRAAGSSQRHSVSRARRRRRRTTTPAGRSRFRWACSSIACSSRSPDRSRT